jgi:hypothetical protein
MVGEHREPASIGVDRPARTLTACSRSQSTATAAMIFASLALILYRRLIRSALWSYCNRAEISAVIRSATILLPAAPT